MTDPLPATAPIATTHLATKPWPMPSPDAQVDRLAQLGVSELFGVTHEQLQTAAARTPDGSLLVLSPSVAPASRLAPLLWRDGKPGFVVVDMSDVDEFTPIEGCTPPEGAVYAVTGIDRGDELANWSPDEALPWLRDHRRTLLTLTEGICWLLQQPDVLERNHCFMTIGSRLRKPSGRLDARTPAIWISNGTGRDGRERRNAPKVGWCWAGNRHTWLGFASATRRSALGES
ncbi:DUF5701 family protein [Flexivirga sp. B27]